MDLCCFFEVGLASGKVGLFHRANGAAAAIFAGENAEKLLDDLHDPADGKKLRTYCKRAHKEYLKYTKSRKHTAKATRKAIGK